MKRSQPFAFALVLPLRGFERALLSLGFTSASLLGSAAPALLIFELFM
jgi:hypothetical protein